MDIHKFSQQIEAVHQRTAILHGRASKLPQQQLEVLDDTLAELDTALEELQSAEEELLRQYEELVHAYEKVEIERKRYQDLFNFAPDGYLVTDPRGIIQEANYAAAELLNTPQQFLIGKPFALFVTPAEQRDFRSKVALLRDLDCVQEWDVCLQPRKSKSLYAALTVAGVRDWADKLIALRWFLRDITERKSAEEQVRALNAELEHRVSERTAQLVGANKAKDELLSRERDARATAESAERRFRELVQSLDAIVWEADPVTCQFTFVSQRAEELLGYPVKQWLTEPAFWVKLIHPEDREQATLLYQAMLEAEQEHEFECRVIAADGQVTWLHHRIHVVRDKQGRAQQLRGLMMDITERKQTEELLYETNQTLRTVIQASPVAIVALDQAGNVTLWNPAAERIFGWSEEEVLHRPNPAIPAEQQAEFRSRLRRAMQGTVFTEIETQRQRKDGSLIDVNISTAPLRTANDIIRGSMGVIVDITERKRMEESLRFQKSLLEAQSEASIDGIVAVSNDGKILSFNRRFVELWGISEQVIATQSDEAVLRAVQDNLSEPEEFLARVAYLYAHPAEESREEIHLKDGRTFDRYSAPIKGPDDAYYGRVWFFRDITDRKQVEHALRHSEMQFRAIFEGAAIGIGLVDVEGRTVESNPALQAMLGYSEAELRNMLFTEVSHPDDISLDRDLFRELIAGKRDSYQLEKRYIRKDGQVVWGRLTVSLARSSEYKPRFAIGMVEDITERQRVVAELTRVRRQLVEKQEYEQRHQARELHDSTVQQLLGISYQLLALRRRISAATDFDKRAHEELAAALDAIHTKVLEAVSQLRGVISALRPAGLDELGLTAALAGYVSRLQRERGQSRPEIAVDLDECGTRLPQPVALCLFRAAQEALRNSLKHAQPDHITLRLRLSTAEVALSVCDDGRGFDVPTDLSALTQAEHFGLVGIAERVAWIGGQLSIRSQPGAGTELTIRIPVSETECSDERDDSRAAGR